MCSLETQTVLCFLSLIDTPRGYVARGGGGGLVCGSKCYYTKMQMDVSNGFMSWLLEIELRFSGRPACSIITAD
jgi:hypothetical protein